MDSLCLPYEIKTHSSLWVCKTERRTETEWEQEKENMHRGSRQTRPDARRLSLLNSITSGWSLFNTYQSNKLDSFCPLGHYIIWNPQGLCDNHLIAWLAWCKALLAEFLYRYAVWQHNVLRERWGCWIRVMQTDRVSWNMKPGRSNLSEKKKIGVCVCEGEWAREEEEEYKEGGRLRWGAKLGEGNAKRYAGCKPEKENRKVFSQMRNLEKQPTFLSYRKWKSYIQNGLLLAGFVCTDNPANIRKSCNHLEAEAPCKEQTSQMSTCWVNFSFSDDPGKRPKPSRTGWHLPRLK